PPFDAPPGYVTTIPPGQPYNVIPIPGGIFLERFHSSPFGYAQGGTALSIIVGANRTSYYFYVPPSSYLRQARTSCAPGSKHPAQLIIHWDAYFNIGDISPAHGLPAHVDTISFPVVGRNGPGRGSFTAFQGQLHYAVRDAFGTTDLGIARIQYINPIPNAS